MAQVASSNLVRGSGWGIKNSVVGGAPALQAGCQRFESAILHGDTKDLYLETAPFTFPSKTSGRARTVNHSVAGSNPASGVYLNYYRY